MLKKISQLTPMHQVLLVTTLVYLLINFTLLLRNPIPWPDEAIYANIASNVLNQHRLETNIWQGMVPGAETLAGWNPPGYFLATAAMFALFGESLASQRLLSVLAGLVVCLLLIDCLARLSPKIAPRWLWLLAGLLVFDYQFMTSPRLARPEMLVLAFGVSSMWLLVRSYSRKQSLSLWQSGLIGMVAGLALVCHPLGLGMLGIGVAYWIIVAKPNRSRWISLTAYLVGGFLPLIIWLLSTSPHWSLILTQINLASQRKNLDEYWVAYVMQSNDLIGKALYLSYGAMLIWVTFMTWRHRQVKLGQWLCFIAIEWAIVAVFGRMIWYIEYAFPFLFLSLLFWLSRERRGVHSKIIWVIVIMFASNLILWTYNLKQSTLSPTAYQNYCHELRALIPPTARVFLSAVPDPYFCFSQEQQNLVTEFPVLPIPFTTYAQTLAANDYMVFSQAWEKPLFGNFLDNYIELNTLQSSVIQANTLTKVRVIQLVSPNERTLPTN